MGRSRRGSLMVAAPVGCARTLAAAALRGARASWVAAATVVLCAAAFVAAALLAAPPAQAVPAYVHGPAQACAACHHADSFRPCSECHEAAATPNGACTLCHPGRTTKGETCWRCHVPGAAQPPATDAGCAGCHGAAPHLGAGPACTSCHSTDPTPHHDALDQSPPQTCTDCHRHAETKSHAGLPCTSCHATDVHPSFPETPAVCNACHSAAVFNGRGDCVACHSGDGAFGGRTDDDIHDDTLPDLPISVSSCTSCHPGREKHAGSVGCLTCHATATAFHHGTAADPGFPACEACHGAKSQHGPGLPCTSCHGGAQHRAAPPTPPASDCLRCHDTATRGTRNCLGCHRPPVYHVPPAVGGCSTCHGGGRGAHAGLLQCAECHINSDRGHHLTRVFRPGCTSKGCHVTVKSHRDGIACSACHGSRASHDRTPRNLPADTWSVCARCHSFVKAALAAGVPGCPECHGAVQHEPDYRAEECAACHDKPRHARTVGCRSCHFDLGEGHHKAGRVSAKTCSDCHSDAAVHAADTAGGASFTCGTCHEGAVHGTFSRPAPGACATCHDQAPSHAGGSACIECHWPAAHAARPDAAVFGSFTPLQKDPGDGGPEVGPPDEEPRDGFAGTGAYLAGLLGLGAALLGAGLLLRGERRSDGRDPTERDAAGGPEPTPRSPRTPRRPRRWRRAYRAPTRRPAPRPRRRPRGPCRG